MVCKIIKIITRDHISNHLFTSKHCGS